MTISILRNGLFLFTALVASTLAHADDAPPKCKYVQIAELPLHYTGPGLQVTTDGTINNVPGPMLVDTGAYESMLTRTGTERRNLSLSITGRHAVGIGGYSRLYNTRLSDFTVGPAKSGRGWFWVVGDTGDAPAFDAIVGAPFLLQADMELSLAEKKMRFFRGVNCDKTSFLGYWKGDIYEIPYDHHLDSSPNPHFAVEVNGKELEAMIDSGAHSTAITADAARRIGLKLDTPGVTRVGYAVGIGTDRVQRWRATVDLKIGAELVQNADIGVLGTDGPSGVDVILGDDFLRAHRVLFSRSQDKLYISYVGGEPFRQRTTLEPWLVQEAESGNPDAQLVLASVYGTGNGVAKDLATADSWLNKAAASGNPRAQLQVGRREMAAERYDAAAKHLRAALDQLPAERTGALWLYVARTRLGQQDLGKEELAKAFASTARGDWPRPIADFFLGQIDEAALLKDAADDKALAKARTCVATNYMWELYRARGEKEKGDAAKASFQSQCTVPVQTAQAK
jgi:predicted aspartyl protease